MVIAPQTFVPSSFQEDIFRAVKSGLKSIVVAAGPGAGKTKTIQQLVRYLPSNSSILMVAFNVEAAAQLQTKVDEVCSDMSAEGKASPYVICSTIHKLGNQTIGNAGIRGRALGYKYAKIAREVLRSKGVYEDESFEKDVADLCDKVRLTLSSPDEETLFKLCGRFEIDFDEDLWGKVVESVPAILQEGIRQAQSANVIDFTDMIWLPSVLNLQPRKYDVVMVDESQDLNLAQRELVLKARNRNGRFIAVGDRNQAIYQWAGASEKGIDEIIEITNAKELPLSICYRCPRAIVEKAASVYPGIQPAPGMPEGEIRTISDKDIADEARPGDLVLSRCTAPLVTLCFEMLRMGNRATIRGRDLGKSLGSVVKQIQKFHKQKSAGLDRMLGIKGKLEISDLQEVAYEYLSAQLATLQGEECELRRANLEDRIDTLLCLLSHYMGAHTHTSLEGFIQYISDFFQEDPQAQIILSTGHRAKGLEFPRVFVVSSNKLPHPRAKSPSAIIQEMNLMYVMFTRVRYMREVPGSGVLFLGQSEGK